MSGCVVNLDACVDVPVYCARRIPVHILYTQCSFLLYLIVI